MNILVPLDGSPLAEQALSSALLFAQRSQEPAALLLVRVNPSKETLLASGDMLAPEFARDHAADAIAYLEHVQQRISQQEVPVEIAVIDGTPADAIMRYAHDRDVGLIVMASHVLTTLDRAMWGSITEQVAYRSAIPTLIIRPNTEKFPLVSTGKPFTILVPLDGSAEAARVLPAATKMAQGFTGAILLMHVLQDVPETHPAQHHSREEQALRYLADVAGRLKKDGVQADTLIAQGDPATHIEDLVKAQRVDMIAIATHGRMGIDLLTHGSTTDEVLHHVTIPMLIYHPLKSEDAPTFQPPFLPVSH